MLSLTNPRIKRWSLRLAGLFILIAALFWLGSHLLLPGLIKKSLTEYGNTIGYEISYQDLSLSPLRLRVELDGLHFPLRELMHSRPDTTGKERSIQGAISSEMDDVVVAQGVGVGVGLGVVSLK